MLECCHCHRKQQVFLKKNKPWTDTSCLTAKEVQHHSTEETGQPAIRRARGCCRGFPKTTCLGKMASWLTCCMPGEQTLRDVFLERSRRSSFDRDALAHAHSTHTHIQREREERNPGRFSPCQASLPWRRSIVAAPHCKSRAEANTQRGQKDAPAAQVTH